MNTEWLNHPAMQNVAPEKKEILLDLINNSQGADMKTAVALFTKTNANMKKLGLSFTKEESDLITEILTSSLSPAEKAQLEAVKKMLLNQKFMK